MANKIVELTLKLNGAETLEDMLNTSRELEDALRAAGQGAEGFNDAVAQISTSRLEIKQFEKDIEGLDFNQQIAGVTKFANGIVGAFSLMQASATLFGSEGSESVEKMVKTMGSLMLAMQAIQAIGEGFQGESIKSLKLIGQGWTKMTTAVKGASVAMKSALVASGIGIVLIIMSAIINNWEKITKFARIAIGLEADRGKEAQKNVDHLQKMLDLEQKRLATMENIAKLVGNGNSLYKTRLDNTRVSIELLKNELVLEEELLEKAEDKKDKLGFWVRLRKIDAKLGNDAVITAAAERKEAEKLLERKRAILVAESSRRAKIDEIVLAMTEQATLYEEILTYAKSDVKFTDETTAALADELVALENIADEYNRITAAYDEQKRSSQLSLLIEQQALALLEVKKGTEQGIYNNKENQLQIDLKLKAQQKEAAQALRDIAAEEVRNARNARDGDVERVMIAQQYHTVLIERMILLEDEEDALERQLELLTAQNDERKREAELAEFKAQREHNIDILLAQQKLSQAAINSILADQNNLLAKATSQSEFNLKLGDLQREQVDAIRVGFEDYISQYDQLNNAADIYSGKLQSLIDDSIELLPSGIKITADAWAQLKGIMEETALLTGGEAATIDDISAGLSELEQKYLRNLSVQYSSAKVGDEDVARAAQQLAIEDLLTNAIVEKLNAQQETLLEENQVIESKKEQILIQKDLGVVAISQKEDEIKLEQGYLAELKKRGVVGVEYADAARANAIKLATLATELIDLKTEQTVKDGEINVLEGQQVANGDKIITAERQINTELGIQEANRKKIYSQLKQELKTTDKIADWWAENGEMAQGAVDIMMAGMELLGVGLQNTLTELNGAYNQFMLDSQANIDGLKQEFDILNDASKSAEDKLADLESLKEDADGARLARIQAEIDEIVRTGDVEEEQLKRKENAIIRAENAQKVAEVDYKNKIAEAEYKQAQYAKAQAIVSAIINTALAVVKAAPNPITMILSAVVGAASIATVASQKIPPKVIYPAPVLTPEIAKEGGTITTTKETQGMLVGDRHSAPSRGIPIIAEGGEWIAPRWMVSSPKTAPIIQQLEQIRTAPRMKTGGGVAENNIPIIQAAQQAGSIDYDLLAEKISGINIWTSVAEIKDVDRKFTKVVYEGSSI